MATPWTDDRNALKTCSSAFELRKVLERLATYEEAPHAERRRSVEIEVLLTSPSDTRLVNHASDALAAGDGLHGEFQPYQLEAATPEGVHVRDASTARQQLVAMFERLVSACNAAGVRYTTIADGRCWGAPRVNVEPSNPRHLKMVNERMPGVYFGAVDCSMQVHVANPWPLSDKTLWARMWLERFAPLLLALGANSYNHTDKVACQRYYQSLGIWSFTVGSWNTLDQFAAEIFDLIRHDLGDGPWDLHPWVKVCRHTLEQRVFDTPGDVREALVFQALAHTLAVWVFDRVAEASYLTDLPLVSGESEQRWTRHALETAARFGLERLENRIISPWSGGMVAVGDLFTQLKREVHPLLLRLGYTWEASYLFDHMVANRDNGAMRQRGWWKEGASAEEILELDNRYFLKSLNWAKAQITAL